ncbi:Protein of unknown function [Gryllus bimaculatus]|nr:Protein of unknown function [Gryllus bimaculatus]
MAHRARGAAQRLQQRRTAPPGTRARSRGGRAKQREWPRGGGAGGGGLNQTRVPSSWDTPGSVHFRLRSPRGRTAARAAEAGRSPGERCLAAWPAFLAGEERRRRREKPGEARDTAPRRPRVHCPPRSRFDHRHAHRRAGGRGRGVGSRDVGSGAMGLVDGGATVLLRVAGVVAAGGVGVVFSYGVDLVVTLVGGASDCGSASLGEGPGPGRCCRSRGRGPTMTMTGWSGATDPATVCVCVFTLSFAFAPRGGAGGAACSASGRPVVHCASASHPPLPI